MILFEKARMSLGAAVRFLIFGGRQARRKLCPNQVQLKVFKSSRSDLLGVNPQRKDGYEFPFVGGVVFKASTNRTI